MTQISNDNDAAALAAQAGSNDNGQAAILLVESLLHTLVGKAAITLGDAIDAVEVASDVAGELAAEAGIPPAMIPPAHDLLAAIGKSLKSDR